MKTVLISWPELFYGQVRMMVLGSEIKDNL